MERRLAIWTFTGLCGLVLFSVRGVVIAADAVQLQSLRSTVDEIQAAPFFYERLAFVGEKVPADNENRVLLAAI